MPPSMPVARALARSASRRNYNQIRCLRSSNQVFSSPDGTVSAGGYRKHVFPISSVNTNIAFQKRGIFSRFNFDHVGNTLSKVHKEQRVLGYSPEQLFNVVAGVDMYEEFLPWCQRSKIIFREPDGSFDAKLEIGFNFFVESYISHVEISRPNYVKTTSSRSNLFDHLINVWEFKPGPVPGTCNLDFLVDFKFKSPFYQQLANTSFKEVVSQIIGSFNDRCRLMYGPEMRVPEKTFDQKPEKTYDQKP